MPVIPRPSLVVSNCLRVPLFVSRPRSRSRSSPSSAAAIRCPLFVSAVCIYASPLPASLLLSSSSSLLPRRSRLVLCRAARSPSGVVVDQGSLLVLKLTSVSVVVALAHTASLARPSPPARLRPSPSVRRSRRQQSPVVLLFVSDLKLEPHRLTVRWSKARSKECVPSVFAARLDPRPARTTES